MSARRVLVLCSLGEVCHHLRELVPRGWEVTDITDEGHTEARTYCAEAAVLECTSGKNDRGFEIARRIRRNNENARIVVIARKSSEDLAIEALRIGAADYLKPPINWIRLVEAIGGVLEKPSAESDSEHYRTPAIIGENLAINGIKQFIPRLASSDSSILITGETGTGKEMIAAEIHRLSVRCRKKFVCVNCSALPDTLIESELFGYERGAFTGAVAARDGKFGDASGGTLFFDEIGDMTPLAQAKILRAIESKEYCRLGGNRPIRTDVRLIAATNRDLESSMREDRFRPDLFFRLNVARIELPTLRSRRADIPLLIRHFIRHYNPIFKAGLERIADEALEALMNYSWPGNVRELKNVVEVVFLNLRAGETIVRQLPEQVLSTWRKLNELPQDEREYLVRTLLETHWNVSAAARKLEWSRMTVYRKLAKYNIQPERGTKLKLRAQGQ